MEIAYYAVLLLWAILNVMIWLEVFEYAFAFRKKSGEFRYHLLPKHRILKKIGLFSVAVGLLLLSLFWNDRQIWILLRQMLYGHGICCIKSIWVFVVILLYSVRLLLDVFSSVKVFENGMAVNFLSFLWTDVKSYHVEKEKIIFTLKKRHFSGQSKITVSILPNNKEALLLLLLKNGVEEEILC